MQLIDAWERGAPNHPQVYFFRGALCTFFGDNDSARAAFEKALAIEPRHELAALALAHLDETQHRLDEALKLYLPLAEAHPDNDLIVSSFSRALRKVGRLAEAKSILQPLAAREDVTSTVVVEMIFIELELGNYRAAKSWFDQANPASMNDDDTLTAAGITLTMLGKTVAADDVFTWMFDKKAQKSYVDDLKWHMSMYPQDWSTAAQMQKVAAQLASRSSGASPYQTALREAAALQRTETPGQHLYMLHCSACHGSQGDGTGYAARHVFPPPRNLRTEPMRLVSTRNGVPSREDIRKVIKLGIPGTAMVPLDTLTDQELDLLVDVVLQMRRDGVRQQYVAQLESDDEPIDEDDVQEVVQLRTTPGEVVTVPELGEADANSLVLGKRLYSEQACQSCHGESGTGDQEMPLFDDAGHPDFPRDLVHDLFKGGNQPAAIYLRILLGMPGTPHPANVNMTSPQLIALSHYCRSLGQQPKQTQTNHQRSIQASRRPAVEWNTTTP